MATILAPPPSENKSSPSALVRDSLYPPQLQKLQSPERQQLTEVTEVILLEYLRAIQGVLDSLEYRSEISYNPIPPKRSFTVRMRCQFKGRGKPLPYPLDDE